MTTRYWWSDEWKPSLVKYRDSGYYSERGPFVHLAVPGTYPANPFGLYDIYGNAWEWVRDWYAPDYYERAPVQDPQGPEQGQQY